MHCKIYPKKNNKVCLKVLGSRHRLTIFKKAVNIMLLY
ncbi:MAG: hypothetical protein AVDCRST_MAG96-2539 [uncultured Segetibacter sp.]|uniref:Uncharacterized protein n=1 Tax=uncultured Segetibacter sp. TaxID=481133 RepID=A0A6J4T3G3_9BACT|nr:MAG: hypothetical protein AVDCRST_MAG96-2539 [uncultured Segetibacter sp.]